MKHLRSACCAIAFLLLALPALAGELMCLPKQVGGTGEGYVYRNSAEGEAAGWWCAERWYWVRNYVVRPPGFTLVHPAGASTLAPLALVRAYIAANPMGGGCYPASDSTRALCDWMQTASNVSYPPLPAFVVGPATRADGTRPTYTLDDSTQKLVANSTRAVAGAPCDCIWRAFASSSSNYCSVQQPNPRTAAPLAVCVKKP